jgi:hypothetical protein
MSGFLTCSGNYTPAVFSGAAEPQTGPPDDPNPRSQTNLNTQIPGRLNDARFRLGFELWTPASREKMRKHGGF